MALELTAMPNEWEEDEPEVEGAFIYCRVSRDSQNGRSVEDQEAECRAYCAARGWKVLRVFTDNDRSASMFAKRDRPEYKALVSELAPGTVVVAWKNNRLSRKLDVAVELRDFCRDQGVYLAYSGRLFNMKKARDRADFTRDASEAEHYSSALSEDVLRGVHRLVRDGIPTGVTPFGFRPYVNDRGRRTFYVNDEGERRYLVHHPEESEIVREMYDRFTNQGIPLRTTAKEFASRGVFPGKSAVAIHKHMYGILRNAAYCGYRTHKGQPTRLGLWDPIVSEELFEETQRLLDDPKRFKTTGPGVTHLLTRIAKCGPCGAGLTPQKARGVPLLVCKSCFGVGRSEQLVDDEVLDTLFAHLATPDIARKILRSLQGDNLEDAVELRAQIQEKRNYLQSYQQKALEPENGIDPDFLSALSRKTKGEIATLQARLDAIDVPVDTVLTSFLKVENHEEYWQRISLPHKRRIIDDLYDIKVQPCGRGARSDAKRKETIEITWKATAS